jgi:hypothetical protein
MSDPIEAMARAMGRALAKAIENDVYACEMTLTERKIIADAAYQALRETLVPVGWKYQSVPGADEEFIWVDKANMDPRYWTETPLFALPEIEP